MEGFSRWDDYLVHEHELIERAMAVLKDSLEKLGTSGLDPKKLSRSLDFLLEFGDRVHNHKEEHYLFPLMGERGIPTQGGPLGVMLMEHEEERRLLREMQAVEADVVKGGADPGIVQSFRERGLAYLKVRAEHIWKENDVLYPMGRRVLNDTDNRQLLERFERWNFETYGAPAMKHFGVMVEEMEKGSGVRKRIIDNLSYAQIDAIMETLPFEVTFVDAEDTVAYFNRLDKHKVFVRTRSVIGRKVDKCHPEKSVDTVLKIVNGFKDGTLDKADFWIDFKGDKILIRYFPVRDDDGKYLGVVEVTQEIGWIQKLTGQKRLLD